MLGDRELKFLAFAGASANARRRELAQSKSTPPRRRVDGCHPAEDYDERVADIDPVGVGSRTDDAVRRVFVCAGTSIAGRNLEACHSRRESRSEERRVGKE